MKSLFYTVLLLSGFFSSTFQPEPELNKEITVNGRTFLYGEINREGLKNSSYGEWFNPRYDAYSPTLPSEKTSLKGVSAKLLMATWCPDSKRNVPKIYKSLDALGFNERNLSVWALDLRKQGPNNEQDTYQVTRVPTLILYRNGKEIGRFIERLKPEETIEKVIVDILNAN